MAIFTKLVVEAPGARTISTTLNRPMSVAELWAIVKKHKNRPLPIVYQSGDTARVTYHEAIYREPIGVSGGRVVA